MLKYLIVQGELAIWQNALISYNLDLVSKGSNLSRNTCNLKYYDQQLLALLYA